LWQVKAGKAINKTSASVSVLHTDLDRLDAAANVQPFRTRRGHAALAGHRERKALGDTTGASKTTAKVRSMAERRGIGLP
jgi:hypothetical protein